MDSLLFQVGQEPDNSTDWTEIKAFWFLESVGFMLKCYSAAAWARIVVQLQEGNLWSGKLYFVPE